jgi:Flp pilus assembly protein TadG
MGNMRQKLRRKLLGRFLRSEKGSSAVEFALVAFPFLYVLGCIIETGLMMFTEYVLQSSVQDAARSVRTGQAQTAAMSESELKDLVCETANIIIDCDGKVTLYVNAVNNFATLETTVPAFVNVGPSVGGSPTASSFECGDPADAAAVIATYDWVFVLPFMDFFSNIGTDGEIRRLVGFAIFRNEPFPSGLACS